MALRGLPHVPVIWDHPEPRGNGKKGPPRRAESRMPP